jgi:prepilin-type N-terminal cleavage/methylation domain-containing protein
MCFKQLPKNSGFSLLELSIVITVISLIIGGIIGGQVMIRNARLQSVMSDVDGYMKAAQTFRDKYNYLPGDFPTAQTFWGALAGCPIPAYSTIPKQATCNGDGNGHIGEHWVGGTSNIELFAAWQHLSNAGLVRATFSGMSTASSLFDARVGINVPASTIKQGGFMLMYVQPQDFTADPNYYDADYGHIIAFGKNSGTDITNKAVISAVEANVIDTKVDDGVPSTGKVLAGKNALMPGCTTSDTASSAAYESDPNKATCALFFITGL